jgi:formylglycine-generating enzyme required for sulfatase activity
MDSIERLLNELDDANTLPKRRADIGTALAVLGDPRRGIGLREHGLPDIEWCFVPGKGVTLRDDNGCHLGDFDVPSFYIAKYPTTYQQFKAFADSADGYADDQWWEGLEFGRQHWSNSQEVDNQPADNVAWVNAVAFCRWLTVKAVEHPDLFPQLAGPADTYQIRLPSEAEWWLGATNGDSENLYAWGRAWNTDCTNSKEARLGKAISVGLYPLGSATCGAQDMAGNVWEWCVNEFAYPAKVGLQGSSRRALRGGSYLDAPGAMKCTSRVSQFPLSRNNASGFRVIYEMR